MTAYDRLSPADQAAVTAAASAVELADAPVAPEAFRALADHTLRGLVDAVLAGAGRQLLAVDGGWLAGYDDAVADRLAAEGVGVLAPEDRATLTAVLLHTVAIPRARGRRDGDRWTDAEPVELDELAKSRALSKQAIRRSLRRLRSLGVLRQGHRPPIAPGPQLDRLTPERSQRLWEDLMLLCQPDGMMAATIRRRRAARGADAAAASPAPGPADEPGETVE